MSDPTAAPDDRRRPPLEPSTLSLPTAGPVCEWEIVADVAGLSVAFVNAYFIGPRGAFDREWVLVDAGIPFSAPLFRHAARQRFSADSRPAAILLTHGHFDHVGALPELAEAWDAPIYCHPKEMPYVTGKSPYPPPDASLPGGMSFLSRLYPRGPFDFRPHVRELPSDGSVPGMPGWRWVATPGHAPGHVSLFREPDGLLLVGDAFVTTPQEYATTSLSRTPRTVCGPPAYFTPDWTAARASVEALRALEPRIAAAGHGRPMEGDELRDGLDALIESWDERVVPRNGRYSREAAVYDANGVVSYPRAVYDPRVTTLAAGLAVGVAMTLLLEIRRRVG